MRRILTKRCPCLVIMVMAVMVGLLASACFGPGTFRVGTDIQPGTYRNSDSSGGCYWARLSGFDGTIEEVITSRTTYDLDVVTISPTDVGFSSIRCGVWTLTAPVPVADDCAYDAVNAYEMEFDTIRSGISEAASYGPNYALQHDTAIRVRDAADKITPPPCAANIHQTLLAVLDAQVKGYYLEYSGDLKAALVQITLAGTLVESAEAQMKQLGQDVGLPGY